MRRRGPHQGKGTLEWIEEAVHLLRTSPPGVLAAYYLGSLPFVLGLLFFWADMSRSPFAKEHVVEAALAVACLFLWMKTWQAVFCLRLRTSLGGEAAPPLTFRRCLRIFLVQATIQPPGLLLIPLGLVITLPFAWVFGFYQNATAIAEPAAAPDQSLFKRAIRGTRFWTGQYHVLLLLMLVFAAVVFLNWVTVSLMLPSLLKSLFGIETAISRSPMAMLNTTFFATMAGLTYLCVDPVMKALHVLRSFRGEAQTTGDDLKSELRHLRKAGSQPSARLLLVAAAFALLFLHRPVEASPGVPAAPLPASSPSATATASALLQSQELDRTIEKVVRQEKYIWRLPRKSVAKHDSKDEGVIARFFAKAGDMVRRWVRAMSDWIDEWMRKLLRRPPSNTTPHNPSGNWGMWLVDGARLLLYALLVALVLALLYFAYRLWQRRRSAPAAVGAVPLQLVPDLMDESVGAEQLPEDEWTRLARELLTQGEFRLAMRAYYLSCLAHLSQRRLITLAKFKSNREYERELMRRGHALGNIPAVFGENVSAFDRAWYGSGAVDAEAVGRFAGNVEKIRNTP